MKILFISPRYEGGIGGHAFRVAEKLRENGFDVKLMHVPHIPIKNIKNPSFALFGVIKALFDKEKYDVVHAWNLPSALIMKYVKAKKKILSVHGVYSDQVGILHSKATSVAVNLGESKVLSWADKLTTDSKLVQQTYKEKYNIDFIYLAAPLDTSKFLNIPDVQKKENQVVYVGRDSFEKGTDILRNIEQKINANVVYCTNVTWEEAMNTLKQSCLMVVPSRMESLPQTIKEAFYLKTPVVATRVGGIPEIVKHDENGILVPPNDPQKLADAINDLLVNKTQRERLASNAYEYIIKNFSWEILLPKYIELYEK
ncbi:MAG: glycosyltransferase family 1 protein [Nitrosopumilaceae archaeon]|nr:glycosyltransferase family 1 protein [Nitrosopumilaceae archaeon]NDB89108.1 glycosyltransferase family 1 protein [Nitrososphaerota archaeon]